MKYKNVLPRRTFLRGAGSVAIALPFLEEMTERSVWSAPVVSPRCVTVFFAEGCGNEFVQQGLVGPLAPWKDLIAVDKKLSLYGAIRQPGAFHEAAGAAVFTASQRKGNSASGPSIDQVVLKTSYPQGAPTPLQTLSMGAYFRRMEPWRHIRSWTNDGAPADIPADTPTALFKRLFGDVAAPVTGGPPSKESVYSKSVLDVVMADYRAVLSPAAGLGAASREKLRSHLDHLRTLERQAQQTPMPGAACRQPMLNDPKFLDNNLAEANPTTTPAAFSAYWKVMADLYALGLHCDIFRFGNAMFGGAAERYRFKGPGTYEGQAVTFNDAIDLHEQFHASLPGKPTTAMLWHLHFIQEQIVYFLRRLDDPNYAEGGKTFLDQHLVVVSTELGNGSLHETDRVFHAVSGAGGRIKTGVVDAATAIEATDFYGGCLNVFNINRKMGDTSRSKGAFTSMLT